MKLTDPDNQTGTDASETDGGPPRVKVKKPKIHTMSRELLDAALTGDPLFSTRLSFDEIRQNVLLDEEPLTDIALHALAVALLSRYRAAEVPVDVLHNAVNAAAKRRSFNVVRSYLQSLCVNDPRLVGPALTVDAPSTEVVLAIPPAEAPGTLSPLEQLPLLFGIAHDDPLLSLYQRYCVCFFVGAIARALVPGCKNDQVFVLQGPQGIGKSSFFRIMTEAAGPDLFHDGLCSIGRKDDLMVMNAHWILEWAEIEELLDRSASGRVKAFLSAQRDYYRAPYGRVPEAHPRHFALAASTNAPIFLKDSTGSRRFLVLPCTKIDMLAVKTLIHEIWRDAYRRYLRNEIWWLSDAESARQVEANHQVEVETEHSGLQGAMTDRIPAEVLKIDSTEALRIYSEEAHLLHLRTDFGVYSDVMASLGFKKRRSSTKRWWERSL